MKKFEVGKRVNIISGEHAGKSGIVTGRTVGLYTAAHTVVLDGEHDGRTFMGEELEYEDIMDCEIDETFFEMATVKWGFMSIKLAIYGGEGDGYPHFHFFKNLKPEGGIPESRRSGGGCLAIESANYFVHEGHTEKLNPKEIKGLIEFLKEKNRTINSITNWEYIVALWNDNNPDKKQLPLDIDIPDYRSDMGTIQENIKKK